MAGLMRASCVPDSCLGDLTSSSNIWLCQHQPSKSGICLNLVLSVLHSVIHLILVSAL